MNVGDVERIVKLGQECLNDILTEYRWAHAVGHGTARGEVIVAGGSDSDPTASVATAGDKVRVRKALVGAEVGLEEAIATLRAVRYSLDHAVRDREGDPGMVGPALVTRAELASAREAKLRRELRGEGWGDG